MMDRALFLYHHFGSITSFLVSLKIHMPCGLELAVQKHWGISLFLSAQQCEQHILECVFTVPLDSSGRWGWHREGY